MPELSALHMAWLGAYQPDQHAAAPMGWHRSLAETIHQLRDWTAASVRRINRDRPTQTLRPGERVDPDHDTNEQIIINRDEDFAQIVIDQVNLRERTGSRLASTDGRS